MNEEFSEIWQFGEFRIDVRRKVLRYRDETVPMPLKELEVLSMLVRQRGELVTKEELLNEIWEDSFVEESNLSRHIYLLRRTLKELGADDGLIENVPRRGYRFTGEVQPVEAAEIVLEKRTRTRTLIELHDGSRLRMRVLAYASFAVVVVGFAALAGYKFSGNWTPGGREISSIAVLPFKQASGERSSDSHQGTGFADILTTRLSRLRGIKVRPAEAAAGLKGIDAMEAGRKLSVDAVLDGTIYHSGDRVRVTARLLDVRDASIIWSGEFEKSKTDEFSLHNDLAQQIVPVIAINVSPSEREEVAKKYTESNDAYSLYLRGRYEWNKRSSAGMTEAERYFRNAIEADPNFALAYVGLADTLLTSQPSAPEGIFAVSTALALDPQMAEAHASRGFYSMFYEWNWTNAEQEFRTALDLNPNYATAHHWYATLLAIKGEIPAAKSEMQKALELNPTSHNFLADLGQLYYFSGEYEEAERLCLQSLELYPDFMFAHEYLHYIYLKTGQYEKAVVAIARADEINDAFASSRSQKDDKVGPYSEVFHKAGINGYFNKRYPGTPTNPEVFYHYAIKHAIAGENEKAIEYLDKSAGSRMFLAVFVKANPIFEELRSDERYQLILKKMGLA